MRIKSHWFRDGAQRSPAEQAGAIAFIAWRIARNMLAGMRGAQFDIDPGPAYFGFMREVLVFLVQVADRMAWQRLSAQDRVAFTTALVRRIGDYLDDNEGDLLGAVPAGSAPWSERFVDQVNALSPLYAEFGGVKGSGAAGAVDGAAAFDPDFSFLRYLGSRIEPLLPEKDRNWVIDQVIAIEAPEAVETLRRGLMDLFSTEPRPARRGGAHGD
jgi:hypothetical protein